LKVYAPIATALPTLRANVYTITLNYGIDTSNGGSTSKTNIAHGANILTAISGDATPSSPFSDNYYFGGWYYGNISDNDFSSADEVGSGDKAIEAQTLSVKWIPSKTTLSIGVDTDWTETPVTASFAGSSAVYNNVTKTLALTLSVSGLSDITSYAWYIDSDVTPLGTTNPFIANYALATAGQEIWWESGEHTITLVADDESYTYKWTYPAP